MSAPAQASMRGTGGATRLIVASSVGNALEFFSWRLWRPQRSQARADTLNSVDDDRHRVDDGDAELWFGRPARAGFFASWQWSSQGLAALVATGFGVLLTTSMSAETLQSWGWRIPFAFGPPDRPGRLLHPQPARRDAGIHRRRGGAKPAAGSVRRAMGSPGADDRRGRRLDQFTILAG